MDEMHLRPAWIHYARFFLGIMALIIVAALVAGFLFPAASLALLIVGAIACMLPLSKLSERYLLHASTEYIISEGEIKEIKGFWAKDERHVPIAKIEDYTIDRTLLGKFLGVANVGIQTARAESGYEITLLAIPEEDIAELEKILGEVVEAKKK